MSAVGAPTHRDAGQERADFCLGNISDGEVTSSTEFIEFVAQAIRDQGFTCTVNTPYSGGEINRRYGAPENGVESILFEINKKRFMDVDTFRRNEGFGAIKAAANGVLERLAQDLRKTAV
jgi:N-formylglutamate amidohydrolase